VTGALVPQGFDPPLRREFDAGMGLLTFVTTNLIATRVECVADSVGFVVNGEFVKLLNGYGAVLQLARAGIGLHAQLICRSMFEGAVTAWWASQHREYVEANYGLYRRYVQNLVYEMTLESLEEDPPLLTRDERLHAERLFGERGQRPWTGVTFWEMAKEMVDATEAADPPMGAHLRRLFQVRHRMNNWMMHSTALAIQTSIEYVEGNAMFRLGGSTRGVSESLRSGWNAVMMGWGPYFDEFGVDLDPGLTHHFGACWSACYEPDLLAQTGEDDPCPCGSGAEFKDCHLEFRVLGSH
jgi:SEC-C motif